MINSVVEFLKEIEGHEIHSTQMFRGHANQEWELLPTLARINPLNISTSYDLGWRGVEQSILDKFMKHAIRFMEKDPKNTLEVMIHAQHHGVPTRLLDWSTNPLKALYFAVENSAHDNVDGVVYTYSPTSWHTTSNASDMTSWNRLVAFHPNLVNDRVAAQEGCFTLFPFAIPQEDDSRYLSTEAFQPQNVQVSMHSVLIPKQAKPALRKQLEKLGVSDASMFPDLDGIAKNIRRDFGFI
ncbi:FRG domain-containing protein [Vibrio parahaemolyticus]|nr:FRG domain-containing protein [Vibrio vulnificus]